MGSAILGDFIGEIICDVSGPGVLFVTKTVIWILFGGLLYRGWSRWKKKSLFLNALFIFFVCLILLNFVLDIANFISGDLCR